MGFHTYDVDRAAALEDPERYAYLSVDELLSLFDPTPAQVVADLGSGTGFYTDDVAPYVGTIYAIDVQAAMHERYREKGIPENVRPLTAAIETLPFRDGALDGAYSTMTYHEFGTEAAAIEIARCLAPDGLLGIGDWSAAGTGETGPPLSERYTASEATAHLESAGFTVDQATERRETFVIQARR